MIAFAQIFDILKSTIQFCEKGKRNQVVCFKCLGEIELITSFLAYCDQGLLSLHKQAKYNTLPLPLRFHIEHRYQLTYHIILFLEEILHRLLGTENDAPPIKMVFKNILEACQKRKYEAPAVDFLKELKSTLVVPKMTKSELKLTEAVVDLLLELRSAKVVPNNKALTNTLLKTFEFKEDSFKRNLRQRLINLGVLASKCTNFAAYFCKCFCDREFFIKIERAAKKFEKHQKLAYSNQKDWMCLECFPYNNLCICSPKNFGGTQLVCLSIIKRKLKITNSFTDIILML